MSRNVSLAIAVILVAASCVAYLKWLRPMIGVVTPTAETFNGEQGGCGGFVVSGDWR